MNNIAYATFEVCFSDLNFSTVEELEDFRLRTQERLSEYHPNCSYLEEDVTVKIVEFERERSSSL